ncbi:putative Non-Functional Immunoglobulin Lambda Variable 1-50 [Manis pentadactyla]|nr:putative Non-Functional Immunoglobulin Lambda Variable 1-50 [Manis pentadactyla]
MNIMEVGVRGKCNIEIGVMVFGEDRVMVRIKCEYEHQGFGEAWVLTMVTVQVQVHEPGLGLGLGARVDIETCGEGSAPGAGLVMIWLGCEGGGEIELQVYGEEWLMSMVTCGSGSDMRVGVRLSFRGMGECEYERHGYSELWVMLMVIVTGQAGYCYGYTEDLVYSEAWVFLMLMVTVQVMWSGLGLALGVGKIDLQFYGEVWVMLMLVVRGVFQGHGLRFGGVDIETDGSGSDVRTMARISYSVTVTYG